MAAIVLSEELRWSGTTTFVILKLEYIFKT